MQTYWGNNLFLKLKDREPVHEPLPPLGILRNGVFITVGVMVDVRLSAQILLMLVSLNLLAWKKRYLLTINLIYFTRLGSLDSISINIINSFSYRDAAHPDRFVDYLVILHPKRQSTSQEGKTNTQL